MKSTGYRYSLLIFITAIIYVSCSNKRAALLIEQLDLQEKKATAIVLAETGTESRKLNYLIAAEYDSALKVTAQQQTEFDSIIVAIQALPTNDLEGAEELKNKTIQYYSSLKTLYGYSKNETLQQKLLENATSANQKDLQDGVLLLAKKKQALFQSVYRAERNLAHTRQQFDKRYKL